MINYSLTRNSQSGFYRKKNTDLKIKAKKNVNEQVFELFKEDKIFKEDKTLKEGDKGLNGGGLAVGALHDLNMNLP